MTTDVYRLLEPTVLSWLVASMATSPHGHFTVARRALLGVTKLMTGSILYALRAH